MKVVGPMFVARFLAWVLLIGAAVTGTTMIVVGLIEEVPGIIRGTIQRTMTHPRA